MGLFEYEGQLVRVTDRAGRTFTGAAEYFPAGRGIREEESLRVGECRLLVSDIARVECLPTPEEAAAAIPPGKYRHFKGNFYQVIGIARHSETTEPMVVYRALYGEGGLWVRPAAMWLETVERDGKTFRRFERVED